jgi:hypothetical protein
VHLGVVNSFLDALVENKTTTRLVEDFDVDCLASQVNDDTPNKVASQVRRFRIQTEHFHDAARPNHKTACDSAA